MSSRPEFLRCHGCCHLATRTDARFCSRCCGPLNRRAANQRSTARTTDRGDEQESPEIVLGCGARCSRSKQPFAIKF
jgi:hypothetical protein